MILSLLFYNSHISTICFKLAEITNSNSPEHNKYGLKTDEKLAGYKIFSHETVNFDKVTCQREELNKDSCQ